jgi:hypothetical protein
VAGDLIPPPSPAGRPDPFAPERERAAEEVAEQHLEAAVEPAEPPGPSRYRSRVGFVLGSLAGIGVAAIAVVAIVLAGGGGQRTVGNGLAWSDWRPTSSDRLVQAAEIAQHVGREYRLNDGSQLADVESGPIAINDVPLIPVIRTAPQGGDIVQINGTGILYVLNGLGDRGSISKEQPSANRLALVEREAMELALYTFRYVKDIDHVVAMLPPAPTSTADAAAGAASGQTAANATDAAGVASSQEAKPIPAMLFRPGDVRAQLEAPLALTFPSTPRPGTISDREAAVLRQFTINNVFNANVVQAQTGQGFLVLDRPEVTTGAEALLQSTLPKSGK